VTAYTMNNMHTWCRQVRHGEQHVTCHTHTCIYLEFASRPRAACLMAPRVSLS
jgi:hypothetical protein